MILLSSKVCLMLSFFNALCVCADSVYARSSADSHVNAAGPQRSVEPSGPRPLCHTVHGHCLGK